MSRVNVTKEATIEILAEHIRSHLGDSVQFKIKNNRLSIEENQFSGCHVTLRQKNGSNRCYVFGFMPSIGARLGLLIGILAFFSIVTSLIIGEFNPIAGGVIPFVIYFLLIDLPSRKLVGKVTQIIRESSFNQDKISAKPVRPDFQKSWLLIALLVLGLIVTVVISKPKKQILFPINQATETPDANGIKSLKNIEQLKTKGEIQAKTQILKGNDTIVLDFQISVKVKNRYFPFMEVGQEVAVTVPEYPEVKFTTTIEKIRPVIAMDRPQIELILGFPITDTRLKEGTVVEVTLTNRKNLN
ncbi:MAG: efflux RND transporter periplasmic adaptor subunit [Allomuricauda sp.]